MKLPYNMYGELDGNPEDAWTNWTGDQIIADIAASMAGLFAAGVRGPYELVMPQTTYRAIIGNPFSDPRHFPSDAQECADRAIARNWGHLPKGAT